MTVQITIRNESPHAATETEKFLRLCLVRMFTSMGFAVKIDQPIQTFVTMDAKGDTTVEKINNIII
jgi:hypothetical protein